jgi:glycosyltransferase involved in cell wall biosynthesis
MKVAMIVQRYGPEVNGGSELLCRWVAEHLSKRDLDVEVLTTCAKDYVAWNNEYEPGVSKVNDVSVRRFPTDFPRDIDDFSKLSLRVLHPSGRHTDEEEAVWMDKQGPHCDSLVGYLRDHAAEYDLFVFFTYLYYTTFKGLPVVADKAILVPTAHDEPSIYLRMFDKFFSLPQAIVCNTVEEKEFIERRFSTARVYGEIFGVGVDRPESVSADAFRRKYGIEGRFIVYAGRIDESKGCLELLTFFTGYSRSVDPEIKLVFIGTQVMDIPEHPNIVSTGFVSDEDKHNALAAADVLIMPSKFESLSIVTLESWLVETPVLATAESEVVKGHCIRSNGGLYYLGYEEFVSCLKMLLDDAGLRATLAANGRRYVEEKYTWNVVEEKYLRLFAEVVGARPGGETA